MSQRHSVHIDRVLDASPEGVFDVVADHANYTRFDGVKASTILKPGDTEPGGVGTVRQITFGPLRFDELITAYEHGRRLDYRITKVRGLPFDHDGGSIVFTPEGDGVRVVWDSTFAIPILLLGGPFGKVFKGKLEGGFNHILDRSAEVARERATAPAA